MRSQWRTWLISAGAPAPWPSGPARWPPAGTRRRSPTPIQRRRSRAPRSPSPWAPSRPASTRTSSTTAASGRSTTTSTRPCSPARPDGELAPGLATELPTQVDDTTWEFTLREGVTFHNGEPFNADSVVATINRMVGLVERGETDNSGFFGTLPAPRPSTTTRCRSRPTAPTACSGPMYWLKQIPASAEETPDMSDEPIGTGSVPLREPQPGRRHRDRRQRGLLGRGRHDRRGHLRVLRRRGDAPRRTEVGALRPDHQPRSVRRRAGPAYASRPGQEHPILILDADEGITADANVRRALNLAVDKDAIAENTFGGYATVDAGQLLSPSILGYNEALEPLPYDPEEAQRLLEEAGAAGASIQLIGESGRWLRDRELLEAIAGYWTRSRPRRAARDPRVRRLPRRAVRPREPGRRDLRVEPNDLLDPDRQLSTYYEAGGIGSSNSDEEMAALIAAGRSELDPEVRQTTYEEALQIAYDQAYFVWLVNNEDIYGMSENLRWTPRVDAKLLVVEMSVVE